MKSSGDWDAEAHIRVLRIPDSAEERTGGPVRSSAEF